MLEFFYKISCRIPGLKANRKGWPWFGDGPHTSLERSASNWRQLCHGPVTRQKVSYNSSIPSYTRAVAIKENLPEDNSSQGINSVRQS